MPPYAGPPAARPGDVAGVLRLLAYLVLAVVLMVLDHRGGWLGAARAQAEVAVQPLWWLAGLPSRAGVALREDAVTRSQLMRDNELLRNALLVSGARNARLQAAAAENARLRGLLELQPALRVRSTAAEVLYEAKDPYSRKLFIDRGAQAGIVAGAPVINEQGVVGQVTRVYPLTAEVTLMVDKDAVVPVLNTRTQQRSAAYGTANGLGMELRFVPTNTDVRRDDALVTSGVDGVYPSGIAVARVADVRRQGAGGFSQIDLAPVASLDSIRHLLVLEPIGLQLPPPPEPAPKPAADPRSRRKP